MSIKSFHKLIIALAAAVILAACGSAPPTPDYGEKGGAIAVGVATVDIINDDGASSPLVAGEVTRWAHQVFTPSDSRGNLLVTMTSARLTTTELEGEGGIRGFFTNENRALVRAEIKLFMTFGHPDGARNATINLEAHAEAGIPEDSTPAESDAIRDGVISDAITLIDRELRARLPQVSGGNNWPQIGN